MFLTVKFKLHNPSLWRRELLNQTLTDYTLAMQDLLEFARDNIDTIRRDGGYPIIDKKTGEVKRIKYSDKTVIYTLPKPSELNASLASSLREALVSDVAAMVASFLMLDQGDKQEAGFPVCREPYPNDAYLESLAELCIIGNDLEAEKQAVYRLQTAAKGLVMPLQFKRSRDFALLYHPNKEQFFLWMKLTSGSDERRCIIADLVDVNTVEIFTYRGSSAVLFPIEVGQHKGDWGWQYQKFITALLGNKAAVKSGKLTRDGDNYFIHVSLEIETPEPYEPVAYLGVNRGIIHTLGYGVIDLEGRILETGHSDDPFLHIKERAMRRVRDKQKRFARIRKTDYRQQELDNIIHKVVNRVLAVARRHKAILVIEDWKLDNTGPFYRSCYTKINQIIGYKAEAAGIPVLNRKMWGAYASQLCIHCGGEVSRLERIITCLECGIQEHVDEANAINLARRVLYKKEEWGGDKNKSGNWRLFHKDRFANGSGFEANFDLRTESSRVYSI